MELAQSAADYLRPIGDALVYINTTKVHPVWFPFALAPTLHAARVSTIFQANARSASSAPLSWGTHIVGFLIMSWGGGLLSHFLLGLPPPMLYLFQPAMTYISVHLLVTLLFKILPDLLYPPVLDTLLWPLDALLRANAIASTLTLVAPASAHPVPLEYQHSPLTHLLLGALVSSGGGLAAGTLGAWTPEWSLRTPPVLRAGAGWTGTLDVWGGALVALIYSSTTSHPAFAPLQTYTSLLLSSPLLLTLLSSPPLSALGLAHKPRADADFPPLGHVAAGSLGVGVLGVLFAARVARVHWLAALPVPGAGAGQGKPLYRAEGPSPSPRVHVVGQGQAPARLRTGSVSALKNLKAKKKAQ